MDLTKRDKIMSYLITFVYVIAALYTMWFIGSRYFRILQRISFLEEQVLQDKEMIAKIMESQVSVVDTVNSVAANVKAAVKRNGVGPNVVKLKSNPHLH